MSIPSIHTQHCSHGIGFICCLVFNKKWGIWDLNTTMVRVWASVFPVLCCLISTWLDSTSVTMSASTDCNSVLGVKKHLKMASEPLSGQNCCRRTWQSCLVLKEYPPKVTSTFFCKASNFAWRADNYELNRVIGVKNPDQRKAQEKCSWVQRLEIG